MRWGRTGSLRIRGARTHRIRILKIRSQTCPKASGSVPSVPREVNSHFVLSQASRIPFSRLGKDGEELFHLLPTSFLVSLETSACHCRPEDSGKPSLFSLSPSPCFLSRGSQVGTSFPLAPLVTAGKPLRLPELHTKRT